MGILLLSYELRLLRCSLTALVEQSAPQPLHEAANGLEQKHDNVQVPDPEGSGVDLDASLQYLVEQIEAGEYLRALSSAAASVLLGLLHSSPLENQLSSSARNEWINAFVTNQVAPRVEMEENIEPQEVLALAIGVASLLAFVQANLTGPQVGGQAFPAQSGGILEDSDGWARQQLMIDGCDLLGKFYVPHYLVLAKYLLVDTKTKPGGWNTRSWWALRTLISQQRCLAERSPTLLSLLKTSSDAMLVQFGTPEAVQEQGWSQHLLAGEARVFATAAQLEAGLVEHAFGYDDKARHFFERAEQTCGLELSLTGALGFRTIYQVDPKAQMVLLTKSKSAAEEELDSWRGTSDAVEDTANKNEVLLAPRLVDEVQDFGMFVETKRATKGGAKSLSTIEQAVILAKCLDVKRSNPDDELRSWQMAPFIEAVNAQQQSHPMVRALCELLRIRWEFLRTRTKERAYLMMEKLAEELQRGTTRIALRMCYAFSVAFPSMPAFLKEEAEMMVSFGLVGEAMRMFEELELWDNLIDCYCLLGKKAAASNLIKQRLILHPNDPRLWCSLGDVTLSDDCYRKAWEASGCHFSRAQRSLARTAYSRGEFAKSMEHWNLALALNPLHPDGWFALGSASLKAKEMDVALNAFTRSVQLNPDNGESWNNLAALNMYKKRSKEAFVAFREALKFKRNSWQMWENFAQVSLDISMFGQAVLALNKVLELSKGKRVDLRSLTRLVDEVEKRKGSLASLPSSVEAGSISSEFTEHSDKEAAALNPTEENEVSVSGGDQTAVLKDSGGRSRSSQETNALLDMVGKLLVEVKAFPKLQNSLLKFDTQLVTTGLTVIVAEVVKTGDGGGELWGLKARWHHAAGDLTMCREAALKQVRAFQGSSWQRNEEKFNIFAKASLQLCEAYIETARNQGSVREVSSAVMHLQNTLKQGEQFSGSTMYRALEACLGEANLLRTDLAAATTCSKDC